LCCGISRSEPFLGSFLLPFLLHDPPILIF
jgi:hypothetical protein